MFLWYCSCKKAQKVTQQSWISLAKNSHLNTGGLLDTALCGLLCTRHTLRCIMGSWEPTTSIPSLHFIQCSCKWVNNSNRLTKKSDHVSMHIVLSWEWLSFCRRGHVQLAMCVRNENKERQWAWQLYCAAQANLLISRFSLTRAGVASLVKSVS